MRLTAPVRHQTLRPSFSIRPPLLAEQYKSAAKTTWLADDDDKDDDDSQRQTNKLMFEGEAYTKKNYKQELETSRFSYDTNKL